MYNNEFERKGDTKEGDTKDTKDTIDPQRIHCASLV